MTVTDSHTFLSMDCLQHVSRPTSFLSTIDFRSGYHQVNPVDQDNKDFACSFGTCQFLRRPFPLWNTPATFQKMINHFCNGFKDILNLTYPEGHSKNILRSPSCF
ncbi:transposon Ty3-G Gag-Pol polyprotein [Trichonephila clavata]|uniref:Transposon Ty3-G Gag-Pol polyprotein n=1 Tax=Trichonephila clavata TaxID=2740835 RepID=A0A8X6HH38_TRICU|nr:transposon Ty3-G Gag-Pol polyprotein [Trichonephila clavata]